MRWTSHDEQEILLEWAKLFSTKDITESVFSKIDIDSDSYWNNSNTKYDLIEYDFSSSQDIRKMLDDFLRDDYFEDILAPVTVGIMKGKHKIMKIHELTNKTEDEFTIPEFVYVF